MMGHYKNFQEVIDLLHQNNVQYLILRNYTNLLKKEMYVGGHGDVDMLVEDSAQVKHLLGASEYPTHGDDGTHYFIIVDGEKVSLDLRHLGDGYYCSDWQKQMLKNRVLYNGFYVLGKEDYFYSLIYHAILQKPFLSDDYQSRLNAMAKDLDIRDTYNRNARDFIQLLNLFMREKGYTYTYPVDIYVPLHASFVDRDLVEVDYVKRIRHWVYDTRISIVELCVRIKHFLFFKHS